MGVAALSVAGRETTLPPMQFILVLYSSHDYPKKGGTSLLWLKGRAVEQRTAMLELMGCGTRLCRVGGMDDHRLHAADP